MPVWDALADAGARPQAGGRLGFHRMPTIEQSELGPMFDLLCGHCGKPIDAAADATGLIRRFCDRDGVFHEESRPGAYHRACTTSAEIAFRHQEELDFDQALSACREQFELFKLDLDKRDSRKLSPHGVIALRDIEQFFAARGMVVSATLGEAGSVQLRPRFSHVLGVSLSKVDGVGTQPGTSVGATDESPGPDATRSCRALRYRTAPAPVARPRSS